jgi:hypothetical protein
MKKEGKRSMPHNFFGNWEIIQNPAVTYLTVTIFVNITDNAILQLFASEGIPFCYTV